MSLLPIREQKERPKTVGSSRSSSTLLYKTISQAPRLKRPNTAGAQRLPFNTRLHPLLLVHATNAIEQMLMGAGYPGNTFLAAKLSSILIDFVKVKSVATWELGLRQILESQQYQLVICHITPSEKSAAVQIMLKFHSIAQDIPVICMPRLPSIDAV